MSHDGASPPAHVEQPLGDIMENSSPSIPELDDFILRTAAKNTEGSLPQGLGMRMFAQAVMYVINPPSHDALRVAHMPQSLLHGGPDCRTTLGKD